MVVMTTTTVTMRDGDGVTYNLPSPLSGTSSIGSIDSPLSSSITPHSFIPGLNIRFL